jgi:predicted DNA-binding transcriptional regulator YafY
MVSHYYFFLKKTSPMQKDKTQLLRLVFIDRKIREGMKSGNYANCSNMAQEYEVSSKSIMRDIDYLKNQRDAPIAYDARKRGYFYSEENFKLPAIDINASDLFALCITEKVLKQHENTPIYEKLRSIFHKIEESLPEKVSIEPSWVNSSISIVGEHRTLIEPHIWAVIAEALQQSKLLSLAYLKPGAGKATKREIEPYHLVSFQGEWYVIGFCRTRKMVLTFAISRIRSAALGSQTFSIPEDFDFQEISRKRFGIFSGEKPFEVTIIFDKKNAPYVKEREWHPSQKMKSRQDGSLQLTLTTSHFLEIKKWILSWGRGAQVLEPDTLRSEIINELAEMSRLYQSLDNCVGTGTINCQH